jgi:hypothetical protein
MLKKYFFEGKVAREKIEKAKKDAEKILSTVWS